MGRVGASLQLPWPASQVFAVASRIDSLPQWFPEVVEAELLDPSLAAGSRIRLKLGPGGGGAEITGTVRELHPPSLIAIAGSGGPLKIEVRTTLVPAGDGCRVASQVLITAPPLLGFVGREAERRIATELPAALERLRALIAAEVDGPPA
jgi:uncharacterized protein YndB with AHSA1/START domain